MTNQEIVSKLWNLCNVLRDDGITSDGKARAAVVLPDNVLFADGDGERIHAD